MGRLIFSPILVLVGIITHKFKSKEKLSFRQIWRIYSYEELIDQGVIILLESVALIGAISLTMLLIVMIGVIIYRSITDSSFP